MKYKKELMIYPFDEESISLLMHSSLINDYTIAHIISPNGWGLNNKEIQYTYNNETKKLTISNDFYSSLENCNTVFFNESSKKYNINELIYPKILKAAESSKNIICSIELEDYIIDKLKKICNSKNTSFNYMINNKLKPISIIDTKIYSIDTPIIFVMGLAERTNKFEIQLELRESIKSMGYKISQIGSKNYCELMGFNSFPQFMYSKSFDESEKIILFNHYIKNIEISEKPDVIIIGVPGGIMPYNNVFTNRFGMIAYELSQAVTPDAVILSVLYNDYDPKFFNMLSESCKYKFGYNIDCYNLTNVQYSSESIAAQKALEYITLDSNAINEKVKEYSSLSVPIYNILNKSDGKVMTKFIIDKLTSYGNVEII